MNASSVCLPIESVDCNSFRVYGNSETEFDVLETFQSSTYRNEESRGIVFPTPEVQFVICLKGYEGPEISYTIKSSSSSTQGKGCSSLYRRRDWNSLKRKGSPF